MLDGKHRRKGADKGRNRRSYFFMPSIWKKKKTWKIQKIWSNGSICTFLESSVGNFEGWTLYPRMFRRGERDDRFKQVSQTRTAREAGHVNSFFLIISCAVVWERQKMPHLPSKVTSKQRTSCLCYSQYDTAVIAAWGAIGVYWPL